ELDSAIAAVENALLVKGSATFGALCELAAIGRRAERPDIVRRALDERAALVERAVAGDPAADAAGVPAKARTKAYIAADLLEASELATKQGNREGAASYLARIGELVPEDPVAF